MKKIRSYIGILTALAVFAAGGVTPAGAPASDEPVFDGKVYGVPSDPDGVSDGGYIQVEVNAPAVADDVSFHSAKRALSGAAGNAEGEESVDGFDTQAEVPAAFPAPYDDQAALREYVEEELPPLRSQGSEGTCWAHAMIALNEIYMLKNDLSDSKGFDSNKDINYSELHMAHFCYNTVTNEIYGDRGESVSLVSGYTPFSAGGNSIWAAELLSARVGAAGEDLFPYTLADTIRNDTNAYTQDKTTYEDMVHMENCYVINYADNKTQIKQAVMENGGAAISYYAKASGAYNSTYNSYCTAANYGTNHGVAIVGWDDEFPAEHFNNSPSGDGAWLIRNSWLDTLKNPSAEPFGSSGYFWLSYYDPTLTGAAYALDVIPAEDDYDHNYRYTNTIFGEASLSGIKSYANVFEVPADAKSSQILSAVRLQSYAAGNSFTIDIYKNLKFGGSPSTGKKVTSASTKAETEFAGIYTIPLNDGVALSPGERYAVVVTPSSPISFEVSMTSTYSNMIRTESTIGEGESYYKASMMSPWKDFTTYTQLAHGNFCIGALTDDAAEISRVNDLTGEPAGNAIILDWTGTEDADSYVIMRAATLTGDGFETVGVVAGDTETYTDTGLDAQTSYYYRVIPSADGEEFFDRRSQITMVKTGDGSEEETVSENATYKVSHYKMDRDGFSYTLAQTMTLQAPVGSSVTPALKQYTGFTAPEEIKVTLSENTVPEIDYYYTRNIHTVTVDRMAGIADVTGEGVYYYDAEVNIEAVAAEGYTFDGFEGDYTVGSFSMPDEDVYLLAKAAESSGDDPSSDPGAAGSTTSAPASDSGAAADKSSSASPGDTSGRSGSTSVLPGGTSGRNGSDSEVPGGTSDRYGSDSGAAAGSSSSPDSTERKDQTSGSVSSTGKKSSSGSSSVRSDSGQSVSADLVIDPLVEEKTAYTKAVEITAPDGEDFELEATLEYCVYDGQKKRPDIVIMDSEGRYLTPGVDFKVSYKNNKNANMKYDEYSGTFSRMASQKQPTYTVKFKGAYKSVGKVSGIFDIYPYPVSFAFLQPVKNTIVAKEGRSFKFLKKGTAVLSGRMRSLNPMRDIDPLRLEMECIDDEHKGDIYTMADNYKAPAGVYVINAYGRGNYYYHKQDGVFTLIRKRW